MNRNAGMCAGQMIGWMDGRQVVGMDIAKKYFQIHSVDMGTGEIQNIKITREKVCEYFVNRAPCVVAMEACGGAHEWGRKLQEMGHRVCLLHAKAVRPFVLGNKTDATDAKAIWLAVQQPGMRFVAVKTVQQQATLVLHRQRQLLVKMRTMQLNALRGMLYEFGAVFPNRRQALLGEVEQALDKLAQVLPQLVRESLSAQVQRIREASQAIAEMDKRLAQQLAGDAQMKRLMDIPGVGLMTATAAIATMGDARQFKSGREFCAWLGLVPRQVGSGGKVQLLGISKRGDSYLRALLVHGARAHVCCGKEPSAWQSELQKRRHKNVAIVAQAAKTARIIWAVTAKEQAYLGGYRSSRPAHSRPQQPMVQA